jgi:hypothetical protein
VIQNRRILIPALVLTATLGLAACGGGSGDSSKDSTPDKEHVSPSDQNQNDQNQNDQNQNQQSQNQGQQQQNQQGQDQQQNQDG